MFRCSVALSVAWLLCNAGVLSAQTYKQLPPPGIEIDAELRDGLTDRVEALTKRLEQMNRSQIGARPDIEVLVRAVRLALQQNLFFKKSEPKIAAGLLDEAERRIGAASKGSRGLDLMGLSESPSDEPQLLVGGFRSRIDDSVQPFGLVIPAGYKRTDRCRIDVWLHGRGDTKTEVPFLHERITKVGRYAPANTIVLHPFGRHCNAFKFAGETDVYEALAHLGRLVEVDDQRVTIRGFSMGGAGCWHLAVHDPTHWSAANPGAGFVDTIVYQGWTKQTPFPLDDTRRKLLGWYDVLPWVSNLSNTRTIAYSGEVDKQKMAADRVVDAARQVGMAIEYVIGAEMGHKIDPASAEKIDRMIERWDLESAPSPRRKIDFVTRTLRYHRADWLSVTGLQQHWSPGHVKAEIVGDDTIQISTEGVTRLAVDFSKTGWPNKPIRTWVKIDGDRLPLDDWEDRAGIQSEFRRVDGQWLVVDQIDGRLRKRPGLQGPIDDAFCDRFLFVLPSRPATHGVVQRWIDREAAYAADRWSRLMRGDVRVVKDTELTDQQIKSCHLICFGDFTSNQYLRGLKRYLPIKWTRDVVKVGNQEFDPSTHAAVFCYPNPRNPDRYLVVNSGMTFREFSNVSNSRQIAMLPDWAVMEVSGEEDGIFAGNVAAEGFFDESWMIRESASRE